MKLLKYIRWRMIAGLSILGLLLITGGEISKLGLTAVIPPGVITPTSLVITLNEVSLEGAINSAFGKSIITAPSSLDVVKNIGQTDNVFATGSNFPSTYNGIRFILQGTGTYSGIDPCTGLDATDDTIYLPDVFNNTLVERFQVPHPVTGLAAGAIQIDPIPIGASGISLRLVIPASNSIGCVSDTPPSQTISGTSTTLSQPFSIYVDSINNEIFVSNVVFYEGQYTNSIAVFGRDDNGNITPLRTIQGPNTDLSQPNGVFVDTTNDEIDVANSGNSSITVYPRTWSSSTSDISPIRSISGPATGLSGPGGVFEFNDEIYVANGPNDSITVYDRNWSPSSPAPKRIIKGPTTGLGTPCGLYVDSTEIAVANNSNNSITFYDRTADSTNGDVYPLRTIKGDKTGLGTICGISVDETHNEVMVANSSGNSINFYYRDSGLQGAENVYPIRQITGVNAELNSPVGVFLDTARDEVAVTNYGNDSVTVYKRNDATPHLLYHPQFINPKVQQQLFISYVYRGTVLRTTGNPMPPTDPNTGQPYDYDPITNEQLTNIDPITQQRLPIPLAQGYAFVWKITDPQLHSAGDANSALLVPPSNTVFHLADGSLASNLILGCAAFTPFIIDELTTNCNSQPFVISPFPAQPQQFRLDATLKGKTQNKIFITNTPHLHKADLPLVLPQFILGAAGEILEIDWKYVNDTGQKLPTPPLVLDQNFSLTYNKPFSDISPCYATRIHSTAAYSSGTLTPDVRKQIDITDTGCNIYLKDISTLTFNVSDAYGTRYAYIWDVVDY